MEQVTTHDLTVLEDADQQALVSKLRGYIDRWGHVALGAGWQFKSIFAAKKKSMPKDHRTVAAATWYQANYFEASMYYNLTVLQRQDNSNWEETVIHELVHLLLAEFGDDSVRALEQAATNIARALMRTWDKAYREGREDLLAEQERNNRLD